MAVAFSSAAEGPLRQRGEGGGAVSQLIRKCDKWTVS